MIKQIFPRSLFWMSKHSFLIAVLMAILSTAAFADKIIADFTYGLSTAFTTASYGYAYGDATYSDNMVTGHLSFDYTLPSNVGDGDAVIYPISIRGSGAEIKSTPDFPITDCVGGFSYKYRGAAHIMITELTTVVDYDVFKTETQPAVDIWTTVTVPPSSFEQAGWGDSKTWSLNDITILKWAINNKVDNVALSGTLNIDDIICLTDGGSSSSGGDNSSSSGGSGDDITGYKVFAYDGKTAENVATAWGGYINGYIFPETGTPPVIGNPNDDYGILVFDEGVAKLKGVVFDPNNGTAPLYQGVFLGIGTDATEQKNISDCTEGLSYWYKGDAHWLLMEFNSNNVCGPASDGSNKWGKRVTPASSSWKKETISLTTLPLANTWNGAACTSTNAGTVDLSEVSQISWGFDDKQSGSNLMIADVVCLTSSGEPVATTEPDASITINTGAIGDPTPVLNTPSIAGLTIVPQARSLQITSAKGATVSLFNARGESVLTKRVAAGSSIVSLEKQKQGLYYAVVQSGAAKQVVKVVVR